MSGTPLCPFILPWLPLRSGGREQSPVASACIEVNTPAGEEGAVRRPAGLDTRASAGHRRRTSLAWQCRYRSCKRTSFTLASPPTRTISLLASKARLENIWSAPEAHRLPEVSSTAAATFLPVLSLGGGAASGAAAVGDPGMAQRVGTTAHRSGMRVVAAGTAC